MVLVSAEGPHCNQVGHGPEDIIMATGRINPKYTWYKRGHKTYVPVVMDPTYSKVLLIHSIFYIFFEIIQYFLQNYCTQKIIKFLAFFIIILITYFDLCTLIFFRFCVL